MTAMKPFTLVLLLSGVFLLLLAGMGGWGWRQFQRVELRLAAADQEIAQLRDTLGVMNDSFEAQVTALREALNLAQEENRALVSQLERAQEKVSRALEDIESDVGTLEKLTTTDPELLQKYSKVFFLNENYAPARLVEIPKRYLYSEWQTQRIESRVWPYLEDLLAEAQRDGITLYIKSAYRSFEEQRNTKSQYTVRYGEGTANTFSADQGYSEHQLGTTVDFITTGLGGQLEGFENTDAYAWLQDNAHRFGFVLSYPKGNQYYIFEPWHWRFVGVKLATKLKRAGAYFYEWDQRKIDEYLPFLFE